MLIPDTRMWVIIAYSTYGLFYKGATMSKRVGNIVFIYPEKPQQCDGCGKIAELRPYGENGKCICWECSQKDPAMTMKMMHKILFEGDSMEKKEPIDMISGGIKSPEGELKKVVDSNFNGILKSELFVSLYTKNYINEPICFLQIGIAMLLNKPIFLLVEEGAVPSEKIMRVTDGIEYFTKADTASLDKAMENLIKKGTEYLKKRDGGKSGEGTEGGQGKG